MKGKPDSSGQRIFFLILGILVYAASVYFILFQPILHETEEIKVKKKAVIEEREQVFNRNKEYESITNEEKNQIENRTAVLFKRVPMNPDVENLLAELADLAKISGVIKFNYEYVGQETMRPGAHIRRPSRKAARNVSDKELVLPVTKMRVVSFIECSYPAILRFLNEIEQMSRLIHIDELEIKRKPPLMEVRMTILAYHTNSRSS